MPTCIYLDAILHGSAAGIAALIRTKGKDTSNLSIFGEEQCCKEMNNQLSIFAASYYSTVLSVWNRFHEIMSAQISGNSINLIGAFSSMGPLPPILCLYAIMIKGLNLLSPKSIVLRGSKLVKEPFRGRPRYSKRLLLS